MFDTLIFFLIYIISYVTISEYGNFLNFIFKFKTKENYTINFFYGLLFIFFLSFFIRITLGYYDYINLVLLILGLLLFLKNFKNKIKYLVIPTSLFIGILISKTHDDFTLYHYSYLNEFTQNDLILGLGNIDPRYSYSSLFVYIQAIFKLPFYNLSFFHIPIFLTFSALINYLFFKYFSCKEKFLKFFLFFTSILLLLKFKRLSEFGYDYVAQFLLIIIFVELYENKKNSEISTKTLSLYLFSIFTKLTSVFFFPIVIYFLLKRKFDYNYKFLIIFLILLFVYLSHNLLTSGCINYALTFSCFSSEYVSWAVSASELKENLEMIKLWSKNFYHQIGPNRIENSIFYLKNFIWFKHWFYRHFLEKIIDSIVLIIFIYSCFYYLCKKKIKIENQKESIIIFILLLISSIFWLLSLPQFRFGFFIIYLLIFFLLNLFTKKILILSNKFYTYLIFVVILFFIVNNLIRINSEFKRQDEYKYKNFPWFQLVDRQFKSKVTGDLLYFVPTDKILSCYNIPSICSLKSIKIKSNNFLHRNIYIITN